MLEQQILHYQKYAKVSNNMHKYANICKSMKTNIRLDYASFTKKNADVCMYVPKCPAIIRISKHIQYQNIAQYWKYYQTFKYRQCWNINL